MSTIEQPQHMSALAKANAAKAARTGGKRRIQAGESVARLLREEPEAIGLLSIGEALGAQHRWGATRVEAFLSALEINPTRRVLTETRPGLFALTARQRLAVAEALETPPEPEPEMSDVALETLRHVALYPLPAPAWLLADGMGRSALALGASLGVLGRYGFVEKAGGDPPTYRLTDEGRAALERAGS